MQNTSRQPLLARQQQPLAPPLPPGLNPVTAGRFGLWLLGQRSHRKAQRRRLAATRVCRGGLCHRFVCLLLPWRVEEYPGAIQAFAELLGISRNTAKDYLFRTRRKLPERHRVTLERIARARAAAWLALADELAGRPPQGF